MKRISLVNTISHLFFPTTKGEDENVIVAKELTKSFGLFVAVDHISFEVKKGEIFGFLGANGAGKSTAIRMLTGISKPTSGKALVAGYDINKEANKVKRNIGYMSQKFSLYERLSVLDNLVLYGSIYGLSKKEILPRVETLLSKLHFYDQRKTMVAKLPLGMKQIVAFTAAILHRPKIVFLDEPTGGVDPLTRRAFWELIYDATEEGITVFVTTHYMDEAEYCDRVSIMVDGQIVALGSPIELKKKYHAKDMQELFFILAEKAVRSE